MKTKEELNVIKEEIEKLNEKLKELSEEELKIVSGGTVLPKKPTDPAVYCIVHDNGRCIWTKETREEDCGHYICNPGCWCVWDNQ